MRKWRTGILGVLVALMLVLALLVAFAGPAAADTGPPDASPGVISVEAPRTWTLEDTATVSSPC